MPGSDLYTLFDKAPYNQVKRNITIALPRTYKIKNVHHTTKLDDGTFSFYLHSLLKEKLPIDCFNRLKEHDYRIYSKTVFVNRYTSTIKIELWA